MVLGVGGSSPTSPRFYNGGLGDVPGGKGDGLIATTWQKAIHRSNSGSISAALKQTIEYLENPEKTDGGELIAT
jgi:hypothetical protein